jgi:hypothetical protein
MGKHPTILTRHAAMMLVERDIEREWIDRTVNEPDAVEPDPQRESLFRAFRAISERNGRVLRVVYSLNENKIRVITAFFDRTRRQ